jgi:hypothetical protein
MRRTSVPYGLVRDWSDIAGMILFAATLEYCACLTQFAVNRYGELRRGRFF